MDLPRARYTVESVGTVVDRSGCRAGDHCRGGTAAIGRVGAGGVGGGEVGGGIRARRSAVSGRPDRAHAHRFAGGGGNHLVTVAVSIARIGAVVGPRRGGGRGRGVGGVGGAGDRCGANGSDPARSRGVHDLHLWFDGRTQRRSGVAPWARGSGGRSMFAVRYRVRGAGPACRVAEFRCGGSGTALGVHVGWASDRRATDRLRRGRTGADPVDRAGNPCRDDADSPGNDRPGWAGVPRDCRGRWRSAATRAGVAVGTRPAIVQYLRSGRGHDPDRCQCAAGGR